MNPNESLRERLERRLLDVIDQYRSMILDPIEQEVGAHPNWKYLRGRLLKALGDRGITGRITEILDTEFQTQEVEK